jgi:hypothetical protein
MEVFAPFTLIGPAAPPPPVVEQPNPQPTRKPRNTTPSATPAPTVDGFGPILVDPSPKPTKPQRNGCFPFCDAPVPGNNGQDDQGG